MKYKKQITKEEALALERLVTNVAGRHQVSVEDAIHMLLRALIAVLIKEMKESDQ